MATLGCTIIASSKRFANYLRHRGSSHDWKTSRKRTQRILCRRLRFRLVGVSLPYRHTVAETGRFRCLARDAAGDRRRLTVTLVLEGAVGAGIVWYRHDRDFIELFGQLAAVGGG